MYPPTPPDQRDRMLRSLIRRQHAPATPHIAPPKAPTLAHVAAPQAAPMTGATSPQIHNIGSWNIASATDAVNQQIDPILKNIADQYGQQMADASSQINAATNSYADALSGEAGAVKGIYGPAVQSMTGAAEGAKGALASAGNAAASGLAAANAQAGLPVNAGGTDINLSAEGAGSSEAAYQLGKASIDALKKAESAAVDYASKLPGFATAEGAQYRDQVLGALAKEMASQLAGETAKAPQLFYSIWQDLQDRADKKAEYDAGLAADAAKAKAAQTAADQKRSDAQAAAAQKRADAQTKFSFEQAKDHADRYTKNSDYVYDYKQNPDGSWSVFKAGKKYTKPGSATKKTNTGPYYQDPNTGKYELKPGYEPGPNGTVIKTPTKRAPGAPKQPTNTGPYYRDPVDKKWKLKPGYEPGPNGSVVKTPTTKTPKPKWTGSAPRRVGPHMWQTRKGVPLSPAAAAIWEKKWLNKETDGLGKVYPPSKSSAVSGSKPPGVQ